MPSRVIRGEIVASDSLSRVSLQAELLFFHMLICADDYGRLDGRIQVLRSLAFPTRQDTTTGELQGWLNELATCDGDQSPLILYRVDSRPYIQLRNWEKHRSNGRRSTKSKFPRVPEDSSDIRGNPRIPENPRPSDVWRLTSDEGREEEKTAEAAELPSQLPFVPAPSQQQLALPEVPPPSAGVIDDGCQAVIDEELPEIVIPPRPELPAEHRPLLNMLSRCEGSPREKELWLIDTVDQLEAEVCGERKKLPALAIRWYKAYLRRVLPVNLDRSTPRREFQRAAEWEISIVKKAANRRLDRANPELRRQLTEAVRRRNSPIPAALAACFVSGEKMLEVARGR